VETSPYRMVACVVVSKAQQRIQNSGAFMGETPAHTSSYFPIPKGPTPHRKHHATTALLHLELASCVLLVTW
jgi:hypothetical protein